LVSELDAEPVYYPNLVAKFTPKSGIPKPKKKEAGKFLKWWYDGGEDEYKIEVKGL
jgi:hypothetical protein